MFHGLFRELAEGNRWTIVLLEIGVDSLLGRHFEYSRSVLMLRGCFPNDQIFSLSLEVYLSLAVFARKTIIFPLFS